MFATPRQARRLADLLNAIAGWSLAVMTALTCADVILRLFRHPILGTYELVGFLGAAVASFAMAHTTLNRGHVAVEVLVTNLPHGLRRFIYLISQILSIFLFALLAFESVRYGNDFRASGEVSLTLRFPFFPVLYGISFSSLVVCLVLLIDFFRVLTGKARPWYRWKDTI